MNRIDSLYAVDAIPFGMQNYWTRFAAGLIEITPCRVTRAYCARSRTKEIISIFARFSNYWVMAWYSCGYQGNAIFPLWH